MSIASTAINAAKAVGKSIAANPGKTTAAIGAVAAGEALGKKLNEPSIGVEQVGRGLYRVTTDDAAVAEQLSKFGTGAEEGGKLVFTLKQSEYDRVKPIIDGAKMAKSDDSGADGAKDTPAEEAAEIKK